MFRLTKAVQVNETDSTAQTNWAIVELTPQHKQIHLKKPVPLSHILGASSNPVPTVRLDGPETFVMF